MQQWMHFRDGPCHVIVELPGFLQGDELLTGPCVSPWDMHFYAL